MLPVNDEVTAFDVAVKYPKSSSKGSALTFTNVASSPTFHAAPSEPVLSVSVALVRGTSLIVS